MKTFKVFIQVGGTLEGPDFHNDDVLEIREMTADKAIEKWLELTNSDDPSYLSRGGNGIGWS
ncbi:hypothetical protein [Paenibacillus sp. FSL M7-1046]|uniref:hypothetical protein n=1 Tax=Paenibacillus sp. FSL M7-1046 TaxID=2975315 RepID=UPI0030F625AC